MSKGRHASRPRGRCTCAIAASHDKRGTAPVLSSAEELLTPDVGGAVPTLVPEIMKPLPMVERVVQDEEDGTG
jgi:hypothetical protein